MLRGYLYVLWEALKEICSSNSYFISDGECVSEAKEYMDAGNALLAAGQLADALTQYNNAIGECKLSFNDFF